VKQKRDGGVIDQLGRYQPIANTIQFEVDEEKVLTWLKNGAQPTDTIRQQLKKAGIWQKFLSAK